MTQTEWRLRSKVCHLMDLLQDAYMDTPAKLLCCALVLMGGLVASDDSHASVRTNVLLIIVDDLRTDIGVYGDSEASTPHIDELAQRGIVFERAYAHQAICAPSRASLLTGLRPKTTGIRRLDQPVSKVVPNVVTLNQAFKNAGYTTLSFGKIYHHLDDNFVGWSLPPVDHEPAMRKRLKESGQPNPVIDVVASDRDLPDRLNIERAREALLSLSSSQTPFFMAVGTHKPHLPFRMSQAVWDATPVKRPIAQQEQQPPLGAPAWSLVAYEIWNYDGLPEKPGPITSAQTQRLRRAYAASVSYVDTLIGDLLQTLDETGLSEETLIVLWSDHGYKLGEYGAWSKHTTHEVDLRIPLIFAGPQATGEGSRSSAIIETIDIYPTVMDLVGLQPPIHLEGASFESIVADQVGDGKEAAYSEITRWVSGLKLFGQSVRNNHFRYTAWVSASSGDVVTTELYDHRNGLFPTVNIADDPQFASELARLETLRSRHWGTSEILNASAR